VKKRIVVKTLLLLIFFGAFTSCATSSKQEKESLEPAYNPAFLGEWKDAETGGVYSITYINGVLTVVSGVDGDGEVLEIRSSTWRDGVLEWVYYVPSTKYVVTMTTVKIEGDTLHCLWKNNESSGTELLRRVSVGGAPEPAKNAAPVKNKDRY